MARGSSHCWLSSWLAQVMEDLAHSMQSLPQGDVTPPMLRTPPNEDDSSSESDGFVDLASPPVYSSVPEGSHVPLSMDPDDIEDQSPTLSLTRPTAPRLRRHDRTKDRAGC